MLTSLGADLGPYWVVIADPRDWPPGRYQRLVDALLGRVKFVQCGPLHHERLRNVVDRRAPLAAGEFSSPDVAGAVGVFGRGAAGPHVVLPADVASVDGAVAAITGHTSGGGAAGDTLDEREPTVAEMAINVARATCRWAATGFQVVDQPVFAARLETCRGCPKWDEAARGGRGKCRHHTCGCTKLKLWLASEVCPLGKWPA